MRVCVCGADRTYGDAEILGGWEQKESSEMKRNIILKFLQGSWNEKRKMKKNTAPFSDSWH